MIGPRFVVYGAGAVGGGIGGCLVRHGHDTVLIARGAHRDAMRQDGLRLAWPGGAAVLDVDVADDPADVAWRASDVVLLAVKGQDTVGCLGALRAAAPADVPVVCVQNGVANEREALRRFANVYGVCVMMPAVHLEPGSVQLFAGPVSGNLDIGRYPAGVDAVAETVAAALSAASFSSRAVPDIMRWKYTKLLMNLGNAMQALCGPGARGGDVYRRARAEAEAVLDAAGIDRATAEEDAERRRDLVVPPPPADADDGAAAGTDAGRDGSRRRRPGGSSWQSLARGTGAIETDYLNGEIVLLGRQLGIATPVNERLQQLAARAARERWAPGSMSPDEVLAGVGPDTSEVTA